MSLLCFLSKESEDRRLFCTAYDLEESEVPCAYCLMEYLNVAPYFAAHTSIV